MQQYPDCGGIPLANDALLETIRGCLQRDQKLRPTIARPQPKQQQQQATLAAANSGGRLPLLEDAFLKPNRHHQLRVTSDSGGVETIRLSEAQVREAVAAGATVGAAAAKKLADSDGAMGAAAQWAAVKSGVASVVKRVKEAAKATAAEERGKAVPARDLARGALDEISKLRHHGQQQRHQNHSQEQTRAQERKVLPSGLGAMLGDAKAKLKPAARRRQHTGEGDTEKTGAVLSEVFRKELAKRKVQVAGAEEDWTQAM